MDGGPRCEPESCVQPGCRPLLGRGSKGLRRLRQEKLDKRCTGKWDDFCPKYRKISRVEADRTIKLWEEFGPAYFELSQLTRVSPQTFRVIAPAIQDGALRYNGETIELNAENTRKVAAAVADLRRSLPKKSPEMNLERRIAKLEKTCAAVIAEFEKISIDPGIATARKHNSNPLSAERAPNSDGWRETTAWLSTLCWLTCAAPWD